MAVIDHLVYAVPHLDEGCDWFEARTGIRPAAGGAHVGRGTHNALVSFGAGYVELIAPDPGQPEPAVPRPFGIDDLDTPRLVTFAVRPDVGGTITDVLGVARAAGYDPGEPAAMSRRTPRGELLEWQLTMPRPSWNDVDLQGTVPFVIDWGATVMPSTTAPHGVALESFTVGHPRHDVVAGAHAALGIVTVIVEPADRPRLAARLTGPGGDIVL